MDFKIGDLPNSSFNILLAKRRSGKSYLTEHIIKEMKKLNMIDTAFLFSGTDNGFDMIEPPYRFNNIEMLDIILENYKIMNEYNKIQTKEKLKFRIKTAIILDDLAIDLKSKKFNIIEKLAVNGRHFGYAPLSLHIFILSQSLTKIPRVVRLNCDCMIMNQFSSSNELALVADENLYITSHDREAKRMAMKFYEFIVNEPYSFCVIELFRSNIRRLEDYIKKIKA
jgi:hypothetical protein